MTKPRVTKKDLITAEKYVAAALKALGLSSDEQPDPELDLGDTPRRVAKMWVEFTASLGGSPPPISTFEAKHNQMMLLRDIDFTSLCSHHLLPFRGKAHIGYIPNGKVVGISKPARFVQWFARQPQTQEKLTAEIAEYFNAKVGATGVGVVMVAEHTCLSCRGAASPNAKFVTSKLLGCFMERVVREEFMGLIRMEV